MHCQAEFKKYLAERYTPAQLQARFGIADLAGHTFEAIAGEIPGMPKPEARRSIGKPCTGPLPLSAQRTFGEVLAPAPTALHSPEMTWSRM